MSSHHAGCELSVISERIAHCTLYYQLPLQQRKDVWLLSFFYVALLLTFFSDCDWLATFLFPLVLAFSILIELLVYWWMPFRCIMCFRPQTVENISKATHVCVEPNPHCGTAEMCALQRQEANGETTLFFIHQQKKFFQPSDHLISPFYSTKRKRETDEKSPNNAWTFSPLNLPVRENIDFYRSHQGLTSKQVELCSSLYGRNEFDIPVPEFLDLFKEHALAPFFVFQMFCVVLWCLDEYWYYSVMTAAMLVLFETILVNRRIKDMKSLREIKVEAYDVYVYRDKAWTKISSDALLPCDIVSVRSSSDGVELISACDILLLSGTVVTNEAMLTGESIPQLKESIDELNDGDVLDIDQEHKRSVVCGGTSIIMHNTSSKTSTIQHKLHIKTPPNQGCIGMVLRTSFDTSQGQLMQTIIFSASRVSVANKESLLFILILLIFALIASGYVLMEGLGNEKRDRFKLLLNCIMIVTSVVPPELPMELTLAVNNSLAALTKLNIFCTEPFRIPFAGAVNHVCFDKTGTLTLDDFHVKGVAGEDGNSLQTTRALDSISNDIKVIISGCHSLVRVKNGRVIGDPVEKAAFDALDWRFNSDDLAVSRDSQQVRIIRRFPFASSLRRMSTVVRLEHDKSRELRVVSKGAAEVMKVLFDPKTVPDYYDHMSRSFSREGCRVLAMGWKSIGKDTDSLSSKKAMDMTRQVAESELQFAGFLIFQCPIKKGVENVIPELINSSHRVVMITGDHLLTACHVAREVHICDKPILQLTEYKSELAWLSSVEENSDSEVKTIPFDKTNIHALSEEYSFCILGDDLDKANDFLQDNKTFMELVSLINVFARFSPGQKELVLLKLKEADNITMMCGDGTNDVGALKQAHVGVGLLSAPVETKISRSPFDELDESPRPVKFGDASIASPFTSRIPNPSCTLHVIRQGRSTLVTTRQMYMILASNSLVSAYTMSVLALEGVKYGDTQITIWSVIISFLFMFLSFAKPLDKLSPERPKKSLFHPMMFVDMIGQFIIHMYCLVNAAALARPYGPQDEEGMDPDADFSPNVFNTVVFLISSCSTIATFMSNYKGHPFQNSLSENKGLYRLLMISNGFIYLCAMELIPELNEIMEFSPFPNPELQLTLIGYMLIDQIGTYIFTRIVRRF